MSDKLIVKLAQRDFVPLARLRERAGERETDMIDFRIKENCHVR